jgi:hypothetical protein
MKMNGIWLNICSLNKLNKQNFGAKVYFPGSLEDTPSQILFFTWYFHKAF